MMGQCLKAAEKAKQLFESFGCGSKHLFRGGIRLLPRFFLPLRRRLWRGNGLDVLSG
jgi:hypothetical protein